MVAVTIIGEEQAILQAKEQILALVKKNGLRQQASPRSYAKHERMPSSSSTTSASTQSANDLEQDMVPLIEDFDAQKPPLNAQSLQHHQEQLLLHQQVQIRTDVHPQQLSFSRHSSSEDSFANGAKSLDSDQMTLSRSPLPSEIQAEQEALIPSFLLGNDPDDSPPSPPQASKGVSAANSLVRRQKAMLSSLVKAQEEQSSRLYTYVKE